MTKEKFLRAIVGDPPLIVEHEDNLHLERELAVSKAALKAQKEEVAAMVAELEAIGRDLSSREKNLAIPRWNCADFYFSQAMKRCNCRTPS